MITAAGAKHLFEAIKGHKALTSLDVSSNEIGAYSKDNDGATPWVPSPEGPAAIADGIKNNGALVKLDASDNDMFGFTDKSGIQAWADALKTNSSLLELNLGKNGMNTNDAKIFADGVSTNGALTSLNVSNNALCGLNKYGRGTYDASGVTALADAIGKHE